MNKAIPALVAALAAGLLPLAALAQSAPPPPMQDGPRDRPTPSAEMRAQMDKMRADTRAAMFAALSPAHRAAVQQIVDDLSSGKTSDPRDAATRIDAILTPAENKAVLDQAARERERMMAARPAGAPGGPGGPPQGGWRRTPDAGGMLLMTSISRERMQELRNARGGGMGEGRPPN